MNWISVGAVAALVIGAVALAAYAIGRSRRPGRPPPGVARRRCVRCLGSGWTNREPERTFTFLGDGFEDVHRPAVMCAACGGSGRMDHGFAGR